MMLGQVLAEFDLGRDFINRPKCQIKFVSEGSQLGRSFVATPQLIWSLIDLRVNFLVSLGLLNFHSLFSCDPLSLSLSLSLFLTLTLTLTHALSHSHSHAHSLSHSLSFSLFPTSGWWMVVTDEEQGYTPASYLEAVDKTYDIAELEVQPDEGENPS